MVRIGTDGLVSFQEDHSFIQDLQPDTYDFLVYVRDKLTAGTCVWPHNARPSGRSCCFRTSLQQHKNVPHMSQPRLVCKVVEFD